jgi:hypothetical protein
MINFFNKSSNCFIPKNIKSPEIKIMEFEDFVFILTLLLLFICFMFTNILFFKLLRISKIKFLSNLFIKNIFPKFYIFFLKYINVNKQELTTIRKHTNTTDHKVLCSINYNIKNSFQRL